MASDSLTERLRWVVALSQDPLHAVNTEALSSHSKRARRTGIPAVLLILVSLGNARSGETPLGDVVGVLVLGLLIGAVALYSIIRIRKIKAADAEYKQEWSQIFHYFETLPGHPATLEDAAAVNAIDIAYWIAHTQIWQHPDLLDKYDARLDLLTELHAVLDAAQDIAAVRRTVGARPDAYTEQWQMDTDALDRLARQVHDRVTILRPYRETVARITATMDDIANQQHRRAAASAVDDLVRRRGGDEMLTQAAAARAAEVTSGEALVQSHLQAAHNLKSIFDTPFVISK